MRRYHSRVIQPWCCRVSVRHNLVRVLEDVKWAMDLRLAKRKNEGGNLHNHSSDQVHRPWLCGSLHGLISIYRSTPMWDKEDNIHRYLAQPLCLHHRSLNYSEKRVQCQAVRFWASMWLPRFLYVVYSTCIDLRARRVLDRFEQLRRLWRVDCQSIKRRSPQSQICFVENGLRIRLRHQHSHQNIQRKASWPLPARNSKAIFLRNQPVRLDWLRLSILRIHGL